MPQPSVLISSNQGKRASQAPPLEERCLGTVDCWRFHALPLSLISARAAISASWRDSPPSN